MFLGSTPESVIEFLYKKEDSEPEEMPSIDENTIISIIWLNNEGYTCLATPQQDVFLLCKLIVFQVTHESSSADSDEDKCKAQSIRFLHYATLLNIKNGPHFQPTHLWEIMLLSGVI